MVPRRGPRAFAPALAAVAALAASASAEADIAVTAVEPRSGSPGEPVTVRIGCGGCRPGDRFAVSLVPIGQRPKPSPCRGRSAICAAAATRPPKRSPFTFLGRTSAVESTDQGSTPIRLHFEIPSVEPGVYACVIYCPSCYRGLRGSLISDDERRQLLRVVAERRGRQAIRRDPGPSLGLVLAWIRAVVAAF